MRAVPAAVRSAVVAWCMWSIACTSPAPPIEVGSDAGSAVEAVAVAESATVAEAVGEPVPVTAAESAAVTEAVAVTVAESVAVAAPEGDTHPLHGMAFHLLAHVFAAPSASSPVVGYMRRGSRFRASEPVEGDGCTGGWHGLAGDGYVCRARGYLLGTTPRNFEPSPVAPALEDPLPYPYGRVTANRVPQLWRIPAVTEERAIAAWTERASAGATPTRPAAPDGGRRDDADASVGGRPDVVRLLMQRGFYVSLDRDEEREDGRAFARTVRGTYVPSEALVPVEPPAGRGMAVTSRRPLPLGFVYREGATRFRLDPSSGRMVPTGPAPSGAAFEVRSTLTHEGKTFLVARDGTLVRDGMARVARLRERPSRIPADARWIHIALGEQTLVAYEGDRPVFATLVSTGRRGFPTPSGHFRIFSKHVTDTMDDLVSDDPYLIEDVPWVMYFERSYALHGAFWHSGFGRVRSHGCVNLAPADAQWLFRWTSPTLPPAWHGVEARAGRTGTHVWIEE
jgi:hypothetical protein